MSGASILTVEELTILENQFFNSLDKIKLEKVGRIYKNEINCLKLKLGFKDDNSLNSTFVF